MAWVPLETAGASVRFVQKLTSFCHHSTPLFPSEHRLKAPQSILKPFLKFHKAINVNNVKRSSRLIDCCCFNTLTKCIEKVKINLRSCLKTEGLEDPRDVAKFTLRVLYRNFRKKKRFAPGEFFGGFRGLLFTFHYLYINLTIIRVVWIRCPEYFLASRALDRKIKKLW